MTGRAMCNLVECGWIGPVEDETTGMRRAVWHVYEQHPGVWRVVLALNGLDRGPACPRPEGAVA